VIHPVDVASVIESFKPRSALLSEMAEEYLSLRSIEQTPLRVALTTFIAVAGDRDVRQYSREDTKVFVRHLTKKGNKTATIRRRVNSLSAILNFAYSELDLDKRNPFKRLMIQGEGEDSFKRGVFTHAQLSQGYDKALASNSTVKLLMPILGETGCRLRSGIFNLKSLSWFGKFGGNWFNLVSSPRCLTSSHMGVCVTSRTY
jgi:site-specific recombinase XerD